jgi:hypothetical protein
MILWIIIGFVGGAIFGSYFADTIKKVLIWIKLKFKKKEK